MFEPNYYITNKIINDEKIYFGLALTPEEKINRLIIVTNRYMQESYLENTSFIKLNMKAEDVIADNGLSLVLDHLSSDLINIFIKNGLLIEFNEGIKLYLDKYQWQSEQFVAKNKTGYVGSLRLILYDHFSNEKPFLLPTFTNNQSVLFPEWKERAGNVKAELSQFAKVKGPQASTGVSIGLLRTAYQLSKKYGIDEWIATIDNKIIKLLSSYVFCIDINKIGPPIEYLGSLSTPVLININETLKNMEDKRSNKLLADFLRGQTVEGFEWYVGP